MSALVTVDGSVQASGTLIAYAGSEVRGMQSTPSQPPFGPYQGQSIYQMSLYANDSGETISFTFVSDTATVALTETLTFETNGNTGSVTAPFGLTASSSTPSARRALLANAVSGGPAFAADAPAFAAAAALAAASAGGIHCAYPEPARAGEDMLTFEGLGGRFGPDTCISSGNRDAHGCTAYVYGYEPYDASLALNLRGHFDGAHGAVTIEHGALPSCGLAALRIDSSKLNSEAAAFKGHPLLPFEAPLFGHSVVARRYLSWMFHAVDEGPDHSANPPDAYLLLTFEVPVNSDKQWRELDEGKGTVHVTCTVPASGAAATAYGAESASWYYPPCGVAVDATAVSMPARTGAEGNASWTHVSVDLAGALAGLDLPNLGDLRQQSFVRCILGHGTQGWPFSQRQRWNGMDIWSLPCNNGLPEDYLQRARLIGAAFGSPGVKFGSTGKHVLRGREFNRRHEFLRHNDYVVNARVDWNTIDPSFGLGFRLEDSTSMLEDLYFDTHPFTNEGFEWLPRNFSGSFLIDDFTLSAAQRTAPTAAPASFSGGIALAGAHFDMSVHVYSQAELDAALGAATGGTVPYPFEWHATVTSPACGTAPPASPTLAAAYGVTSVSVSAPVETRPSSPEAWSGSVAIAGVSVGVSATDVLVEDAAHITPLTSWLRPKHSGACAAGYRVVLTGETTYARPLDDSALAAVVDTSGVSVASTASIDSLQRGLTRMERLDMTTVTTATDVPLVALKVADAADGRRQVSAGCSSSLYEEDVKSRWADGEMDNLPAEFPCLRPSPGSSPSRRRLLAREPSDRAEEDYTHILREFPSVQEAMRTRRHGADTADLSRVPSHRVRLLNASHPREPDGSRRRLAQAPPDPAYANTARWSETSTWGGACPPNECADDTEILLIASGSRILFDMVAATVRYVIVEGTLVFEDARDAEFGAEAIIVHKGGELIAGSADFPFTHKLKITLYGHQASPWLPVFGTKVLGVGGMGKLQLHGAPVATPWTLLGADAQAGATQLTLATPVSDDWAAGDKIYITSTNRDSAQGEEAVLTAVSSDRLTLTLAAPLAHGHAGHVEAIAHTHDAYTGSDHPAGMPSSIPTAVAMRAEVMKLTRTITVTGNSPSDLGVGKGVTNPNTGEPVGKFKPEHQFGAQVFSVSIDRPVTLEYVAFEDMGQAFNLGKYAVHYHVPGLSSEERDAKRTDGGGAKYVGNSCYKSFNRMLTMHSIRRLDVRKNVGADIMGHAIFLEDGDETDNSVVGNAVARVRVSRALLGSDATPSAYWITNPTNAFEDNHCGGSEMHCFWYDLADTNRGSNLGNAFGSFSGNVAHSCTMGLRLWAGFAPTRFAHFYNFTVFSSEYGIRVDPYDEGIRNVRFDHVMAADNEVSIGIQNTQRQGNYEFPQLTNALVIGATSSPTRDFSYASAAAFEFGQVNQYGASVDSVVVANVVGGHRVFTGCNGCKGFMGGQMIRLNNMHYTNVERMVFYRHPMEAVYYDADGSTTGKGAGSWMAALDPALVTSPSCEVHTQWEPNWLDAWVDGSAPIGGGPRGMVCDSATELTTIRIRRPKPAPVLWFRDMFFYRVPADASGLDDAAYAASALKSTRRPFQPYGLCGLRNICTKQIHAIVDGAATGGFGYIMEWDFNNWVDANGTRMWVDPTQIEQLRFSNLHSGVAYRLLYVQKEVPDGFAWNGEVTQQYLLPTNPGAADDPHVMFRFNGAPESGAKYDRTWGIQVRGDAGIDRFRQTTTEHTLEIRGCPPAGCVVPSPPLPPVVAASWDWCGVDPSTNAVRAPGDPHPSWPGGFVPGTNEDVHIDLGKDVTVDCDTATVNRLTVRGVLGFKEGAVATLNARRVVVLPLGRVQIGQSAESPHSGHAAFALHATRYELMDYGFHGATIGVLGEFHAHAAAPASGATTSLSRTAQVGDTTLVVAGDHTDWMSSGTASSSSGSAGPRIAIAATTHGVPNPGQASVDSPTVAAASYDASVDETTFTLDSPVEAAHLGANDGTITVGPPSGSRPLAMAAEVSLLSRNVEIYQANALGISQRVGASLVAMTRDRSVGAENQGVVDVSGIEVHHCSVWGDPKRACVAVGQSDIEREERVPRNYSSSRIANVAIHTVFSGVAVRANAAGLTLTSSVFAPGASMVTMAELGFDAETVHERNMHETVFMQGSSLAVNDCVLMGAGGGSDPGNVKVAKGPSMGLVYLGRGIEAKRNRISGFKVGMGIDGAPCGSGAEEGNVAHSCLVGYISSRGTRTRLADGLVPGGASEPWHRCTELKDFTAWRNDWGAYAGTLRLDDGRFQGSFVVSQATLVDNFQGLFAQPNGPFASTHEVFDLLTCSIFDSVFVGDSGIGEAGSSQQSTRHGCGRSAMDIPSYKGGRGLTFNFPSKKIKVRTELAAIAHCAPLPRPPHPSHAMRLCQCRPN